MKFSDISDEPLIPSECEVDNFNADYDYLLFAGWIDNNYYCRQLKEGKWVSGELEKNIRIDQPTHGAGKRHAHVFARKRKEVGVVNVDGSGSHGSGGIQLKSGDADALRKHGFSIPPNNIIEMHVVKGNCNIILEGNEEDITNYYTCILQTHN